MSYRQSVSKLYRCDFLDEHKCEADIKLSNNCLFDGNSVGVHQRVGKHAAEDLLDQVQHHAFPEGSA